MKFVKYALLAFGFLVVGVICVLILNREHQMPHDPRLPSTVKQYVNKFSTIRLVDVESNVTLFTYDIESQVYPTGVQKTADGKWQVTLERRAASAVIDK